MNLGKSIKHYLSIKKTTQMYLTQEANIELKRLNALLNEGRKMTAEEYLTICKVLNVPLDTFVRTA